MNSTLTSGLLTSWGELEDDPELPEMILEASVLDPVVPDSVVGSLDSVEESGVQGLIGENWKLEPEVQNPLAAPWGLSAFSGVTSNPSSNFLAAS